MKTLLLFLLLCSQSFARIGETRAQCETRYGPAIEVQNEGETTLHVRAGFKVECSYFEGKCDCILFRKMAARPELEDLPLTEADQKTLMDANAGGKTWSKKRDIPEINMQEWACEGLQAVHDGGAHDLRIHTDAYGARFDAKWAAKEAADKAAREKGGSKGSLKDF